MSPVVRIPILGNAIFDGHYAAGLIGHSPQFGEGYSRRTDINRKERFEPHPSTAAITSATDVVEAIAFAAVSNSVLCGAVRSTGVHAVVGVDLKPGVRPIPTDRV